MLSAEQLAIFDNEGNPGQSTLSYGPSGYAKFIGTGYQNYGSFYGKFQEANGTNGGYYNSQGG